MGHSKDKLTIPMGVQAELDIETGNIVLKESPFSNIKQD
jgi:muramoyltetrapeptide carboxypeptidase LdcA involved in peptidoglycan recycling